MFDELKTLVKDMNILPALEINAKERNWKCMIHQMRASIIIGNVVIKSKFGRL